MRVFMLYLFISVATISSVLAMDPQPKSDKKEKRKSEKFFRSGRTKANSLSAVPENTSAPQIDPLSLKAQTPTPRSPNRNSLTKDNLPDISTLKIHDHDPRIINAVRHEKYYDLMFGNFDHINIHDQLGFTALIWAVCKQNIALVEIILDEDKLDINATDRDGNTALHHATVRGDAEMVTLLLRNKKLLVNKRNNLGYAPLHCAANQSLHKIIDLFHGDARFTFAIRVKPNDRRSSIGPTPHDLINVLWPEERARVLSRQRLDETVKRAINEKIQSCSISLQERFSLTDLTRDDIESILKKIKSLVFTDWKLPDYVDDNFIREMIISRITGLTPHK